MSEPLSGEEQRLLYLFAEWLTTQPLAMVKHEEVVEAVETFTKKFDADPAAHRWEIAPGRESLREQSDVEGGERR